MSKASPDFARFRSSHTLALAVATALGSVPPGIVLAQNVQGLEEITVTATRRAVTVQEIPFNIAALSGQDIARQRLTNLAELTRVVPGLYLVDQGGRDGNLMTVRGLNVSDLNASEFNGNASGGSVATYLGDIPYYMDLRLLDIERVEVLLGPQGTLYGAGTLTGAIRYIPTRPQLDEITLELGGDLYQYSKSSGLGTDASVVFNLPLISDRLALRASVGYYDTPGFIDYNFLVREPGVSNPQPDFSDPADVEANLRSKRNANTDETWSTRLALLWEATDYATANLSYYYQRQKIGARQINHRESFGTGRYESAHRFLEPNDRENHLVALEVDVDLGFATLTSASGYGKYESEGQRDQTDLLLDFQFGYELFPAFVAFTRETNEEKTFNQELRLVSKDEGPLNWILGAYYNRFRIDALSLEFTPGIPDFFGIDRPDNLEYYQKTDGTFTERALFGELGYQLTDRWDVTVGGRWYRYRDELEVGIDLPLLFGMSEGVDPFFDGNRISSSGNLFKFNTSYMFSDELFGYLTISEGFRRGGVNAIASCDPDLGDDQQFVCALPDEQGYDPDTTTNYEIGLRARLLENRLSASLALYNINWKDVQVADITTFGAVPITVNGAKARSRGYEAALDALLTEQLRLLASYSYTSAKLRRSGDRLPGAPQHQGSVVLNWSQPLAGEFMLEADYGISVVSDVYTRAGDSENALAGYALHNIAVGVVANNWSVRLYADNLFDKYAETGVRLDPSFIRDVNGFDLRRYYKDVTAPRRVGLQFTYRFDL